MLWQDFPGGKHTRMKIREGLEAKVLAGDAEKLAFISQLSLGDIWLILGAHRLPIPHHWHSKIFLPLLPAPQRQTGTLHTPFLQVTPELCIFWDDTLGNTS